MAEPSHLRIVIRIHRDARPPPPPRIRISRPGFWERRRRTRLAARRAVSRAYLAACLEEQRESIRAQVEQSLPAARFADQEDPRRMAPSPNPDSFNIVTLTEVVLGLLQAEKASGKATVRSLGMIYALAIGAVPAEADETWAAIHRLVRSGVANEPSYLISVKRVGWATYDAFVARPRGNC